MTEIQVDRQIATSIKIELFPPNMKNSEINSHDHFIFESESRTPAAVCTDVSLLFTRYFPDISSNLLEQLSKHDTVKNNSEVGFIKCNLKCKYKNNTGVSVSYRLSLCVSCLLEKKFYGENHLYNRRFIRRP